MRNGQVEEKKVSTLKRELKLKEFQFNSIYEFSEAIYSHFQMENVVRIYFSTLMAQLGISRAFIYDSANNLFERRGFKPTGDDIAAFTAGIKKLGNDWFSLNTDELPPEAEEFKALLDAKKIRTLVNVAEAEEKITVLGLGPKFNKKELTTENVEYSFLVSKFALSAIENALLIDKLIESKRIEHELKIARDIQLSLLPQSVPEYEHFELAVVYEPINDVGGDYYDILKERKDEQPVIIADVEGKGLSAALLAASSQATFHSLNQLYFFDSPKFIAKANSMICELNKGTRFITIFWMLLNDKTGAVTYVNAGHVAPALITEDSTTLLEKGGFLTGFIDSAEYEAEELKLNPGDIIVAFTDGVPEVENLAGEEYGEEGVFRFVRENRHLPAKELADTLTSTIAEFSQGKKYRDDFTLIILKSK